MRTGIGSHTKAGRGQTDVWLTPPGLIEALGPFDLDPCAAPDPKPWPTARRHYTLGRGEDGLMLPWEGLVFCNPPYGPQTGKWLGRCADHGNALALVFARTETRTFVETVWRSATAVFFLHGRPHFHLPTGERARGNSGGPLALIAYGPRAVSRLTEAEICGMAGTLVRLR